MSDLAASAGVPRETVRYYERVGLIAPPLRASNGYRMYEPSVRDRIRFIKGAQRSGLRLREIRELLEIRDRGACPCGHTRELVAGRMAEVEGEIRRLSALRDQLAVLLVHPDACGAVGNGTWDCRPGEGTARGGGDAARLRVVAE